MPSNRPAGWMTDRCGSLWVLAVGGLLAACQGSSIGTSSMPLAEPAAGIDVRIRAPEPVPICLADSDCAALETAPCLRAVCDPSSRRCALGVEPDFSACDDGDPCSLQSHCVAGSCRGVTARDCDDGQPCSDGRCDSETGACEQIPAPGDCDDGNPCTAADHCAGGGCVAGLNVCACKSDAECATAGGGDPCVGKLSCSAGSCVLDPATMPHCATDEPCRVARCSPVDGSCTTSSMPDGTGCDDGSACTADDRCRDGACTAGTPIVCPGNSCALSKCDPQLGCGADPARNGRACDDGSSCTADDRCVLGVCTGTPTCPCVSDADCQAEVAACAGVLSCRAGQCELEPASPLPCPGAGPCRLGVCTEKGCELRDAPAGTACDDGNACVHGSTCDDTGACTGGAAPGCDDHQPCTLDACRLATGCTRTAAPDGRLCEDGIACTTVSLCAAGSCAPSRTVCDDGQGCTFDWCDPAKPGACLHLTLADGTACDDGDACTTGDTCELGLCAASTTTSCDDGNVCTRDGCESSGQGVQCVHAAWPAGKEPSCNDGNPCSTADRCVGEQCVGVPGACECQEAADCAPKEDGDACNGTLVCAAGKCVLDPLTVVACGESANPCLRPACVKATGQCVDRPRAGVGGGVKIACDDENPCTHGEVCLADGSCGGGAPVSCDDGDACTIDLCDEATGCTSKPATGKEGSLIPCDDGNECTKGDHCDAGGCRSGTNACQCLIDADCALFDDGDLCDGALICKEGTCVPDGRVVTCPDQGAGPCRELRCQPGTGKCLPAALPAGTTCTTGDPCPAPGICGATGCTPSGSICEDGNPCTTDACDAAAKACTHTAVPAQTPCDDGDACTGKTLCSAAGVCGGGVELCVCSADSDCPDDGNACDGVQVCFEKQCGLKPGSVVVCDATNDTPCRRNTCSPKTGTCAPVLAEAGSPCEDGDQCTEGTVCEAATCGGGAKIPCDDANPCTSDGCTPSGGCLHLNNTAPCQDGNACTVGDHCQAGQCVPGPNNCDCKLDGDCVNDADLCNGVVVCVARKCQLDPKSVVSCDSALDTACRMNLCDKATGKCAMTSLPDGRSCDDGSVCTSKDRCRSGTCAGDPASCDDHNPCSLDACHPKTGCHNTAVADGTSCDDANACTKGEACSGGVCRGGTNTCGTCKVDGDCAAKDDGDLCNGVLFCDSGTCKPKPDSAVHCADDGHPCTTSACVPATGKCVSGAAGDGAACDDGNVCTGSSACISGACVGTQLKDCDDADPCTADRCDPAKGCASTGRTGLGCDDGNPCTAGDVCLPNGTCNGLNTCECQADADCKAKDDGNLCNGTLGCRSGKCAPIPGTVVSCDTSGDGACRVTACVPATGKCASSARPDGSSCDDSTACTSGDRCASGACHGTALDCDDGNACTRDACDAAKGCTHAADDQAKCQDGNPCTKPDRCHAAACVAGPNNCQCQAIADCAKFEDGNLCNGTLVCSANACVIDAQTIVSCPDDTACTRWQCAPATGKCAAGNRPDGRGCGGEELCGGSGVCAAGVCKGEHGCAGDGNPCTAASCDGKGGCSQKPLAIPCDDGDLCTTGDLCQGGTCIGKGQCACKVDADCSGFDDGDKCNGVFVCRAGQCRFDASTVVQCGDGAPCKKTFCQAATGKCVTTDRPTGSPCPDGDACTRHERCVAGSCQTEQVDCDDHNVCTDDACKSATGCVHANNGFTCNDGDPCTPVSACVGGTCRGFGNTCSCTVDSDCKQDGDLCNGTATCQSGTCRTAPGSVVVCSPSKTLCFANTCVPATGKCRLRPAPNGSACDDGSACTGGDACVAGKCLGVPVDCDDKVACTADACDPESGCNHTPRQSACDDGNPCTADQCVKEAGCRNVAAIGAPCDDHSDCTAGETCRVSPKGPVCGGGIALECDDGKVCTDDSCGKKGCEFKANTAPCDDANPCTIGEVCSGGSCSGSPVSCDDGNACTDDLCDPATGKCVSKAVDGGGCDDGNACTGDGLCSGGSCKPGAAISCDDGNQCTADPCDPASGCAHTPKPDGSACDDGNLCTGGELCASGACAAGTRKNCDDGNVCTADSCNPADGRCEHRVNGGKCDDGNPCTADHCDDKDGSCSAKPTPGSKCDDGDACTHGDACDASGTCIGQGGCDDGNQCTADRCASGACAHDPLSGAPCDDGNPCSAGDRCASGTCKPATVDPDCCVTAKDCDDDYACTTELCTKKGCRRTPVACQSDGSACTVETCRDGSCGSYVPNAVAPIGIYEESFDDGVANGIYTSSDNADIAWSISARRASGAGGKSLYAGNPEAATYDFGKSRATFRLPPIALGKDGAVYLSFKVFARLADGGCDKDTLTVTVTGGAKSVEKVICASTTGFEDRLVQLVGGATDFGGTTVEIAFVFAADAMNNHAEGVYVDDLKVLATTDGASCCKGPQDCDDGKPCTFDACSDTTGTCSNQILQAGQPCSDGDACTGDAAGNDHCDAAGNCTGPAKDCGDGDACTADHCDPPTGKCSHESFAMVQQDFNQDTAGFSFAVLGQGGGRIKWQLSDHMASSKPTALYCGHAGADGKYDFDVGSFLATATYKPVHIPKGAGTAYVRLKYRFDTSEGSPLSCGPFDDRIQLLVDGANVAQRCYATPGGGWQQFQYDLGGKRGEDVSVALRFQAIKTVPPLPGSKGNTGQGPWFDDFEIGWTCN